MSNNSRLNNAYRALEYLELPEQRILHDVVITQGKFGFQTITVMAYDLQEAGNIVNRKDKLGQVQIVAVRRTIVRE